MTRYRTLLVCAIVLVLGACSAASPTPAPPVAPGTAEPFYAPDFTLKTLYGDEVTLSKLRGRRVILNFWATWCGPCIAEMPLLQSFADKYIEEARVIGVNVREPTDVVRAFVDKYAIRFTILIAPDDATLLNYQVIGLPQTLFLDANGAVICRQFGPIDSAWLERCLKNLPLMTNDEQNR